MAKGLDIQRRIKSIKSIRSITKAMEMVAASKMRRAQEQALRTRSYAQKALEILANVSEKALNYNHYLLKKSLTKKEGNRYLVLVVTSNKGLCGSLNTNVTRKMMEFMETKEGVTKPGLSAKNVFHFVTLGKKAREVLFRMKQDLKADFSDMSEAFTFLDVAPLTKFLLDEYKKGQYDRVYVIYTHFISVLAQKAVVKRIVPLGKTVFTLIKEIWGKKIEEIVSEKPYEYKFEPSPREVLEELLPILVEMQVYQTILEAYASEQSARMMAMRNATDAASDFMNELTLYYNKTRQASITQEISEIVGGVEALRKVQN